MSSEGKIICNWKMRTLTPVHVGGAQEKHWKRGVDYVTNNGVVHFIDTQKIIDKWGVDKYCNALEERDGLVRLLRNNLDKYTTDEIKLNGAKSEIKRHIYDPLTSNPIIPGSSIKGAIRSALLHKLIERDGHRNDYKQINERVFGGIDQDFMRYIQIADVKFRKVDYVNTKVFNLVKEDRAFVSRWKKDLRGDHRNITSLNPNDFASAYEVIPAGEMADIRIVFNHKAYKAAVSGGAVHQPTGIDKVLNENFESNLLDLLRNRTLTHLSREVDFFTKYEGAQYQDKIVASVGSLHEEAEREDAAAMRMAAGSGFHAITGDWMFDHHEINGIGGGSRGQYNRKDSAKSRKIVISLRDKELFMPMGFVQFMTEEVYERTIGQEVRNREIEEQARKEKEENERRAIEAAKRQAEEEAKKPKMTPRSAFKKNKPRTIDVEVVDKKIGKIYLKPFVEGFDSHTIEMVFRGQIDVGAIRTIQALITKKGALNLQGYLQPKK